MAFDRWSFSPEGNNLCAYGVMCMQETNGIGAHASGVIQSRHLVSGLLSRNSKSRNLFKKLESSQFTRIGHYWSRFCP
jgi:hypothetical protein